MRVEAPHELLDRPSAASPRSWHPDLARGVAAAQEGLAQAHAALQRHEQGAQPWHTTQSVAVAATREAIGAVDAVLAQFEDLPEPVLDALVGASNESRRLLETVQGDRAPAGPGIGAGYMSTRYQRVMESLSHVMTPAQGAAR